MYVFHVIEFVTSRI